MRPFTKFILSIALISFQFISHGQSNYSKPWTYWWWMGSAVNEEGIKLSLNQFSSAGFGGVHIIPIYGVKGEELNFIPFLSQKWMDMLKFTIAEAEKLGMNVDMTCGTGWPFGGPFVKKEDAAHKFEIIKLDTDHRTFKINKPGWKVKAISAYNENNEYHDLTGYLKNDSIFSWKEPKGKWKYYVIYQSNTFQNVKRAAPGGEGLTLDPFSKSALLNYTAYFDSVFKANNFTKGVRAFYNDSYEVFGANWTNNFLEEFKSRRKYDLKQYLDLMAAPASNELSKRLWMDYHQTIHELILENFTESWVKWAHGYGALTRNECHGSPGNLLDLYAANDIPETETFGSSGFNIPLVRVDSLYPEKQFGRPNPLIIKFASSAANITGKKYVGSESCTWLADHFKVALSQVKPQLDELFVCGVNHLSYHGITYSPPNATFPGWLFYASTNFGPFSHFWKSLPELNNYVANCQQLLQETRHDNEILIYFPINDSWTKPGEQKLIMFDVHGYNLKNSSMTTLAENLAKEGYGFDYISDKQLTNFKFENTPYKCLIIPSTNYIPVETLNHILAIASKGIPVLFLNGYPRSTASFYNYLENEELLDALKTKLNRSKTVKITKDIIASLTQLNLKKEELAGKGLSYIRKTDKEGNYLYFISNLSNEFNQDTITFGVKGESIEYIDPLRGDKGFIKSHLFNNNIKAFLKIEPGSSAFIKVYLQKQKEINLYKFADFKNVMKIKGKWKLKFLEGAPIVPQSYVTDTLISWTAAPDTFARYFSGTCRYTLKFDIKDTKINLGKANGLNLGDIRETAIVSINGKKIGNVWCVPYKIIVPPNVLKKKGNIIEIDVTNLSLNRVIYMDKQKIPWKKFYDINMVNIQYQPYDAGIYSPVSSGLLGNVELYYE